MLRALSIPTLAARRKQLKLCTFFSYVNGLSIAPIANLISRWASVHQVHLEVKLVCMLSEPSSSLHMLRQKFAGSYVPTRAALSLFASKFPLI